MATAETRPKNPVYKFLREGVRATLDNLHLQHNEDPLRRQWLTAANEGVQCYMRWQDIVAQEDLPAMINEFKLRDSVTRLHVTNDSAINYAIQNLDCTGLEPAALVALYAPNTANEDSYPHADPCGMVNGGLPGELTDLALRSTLLWHLRAKSLHLSDSHAMCKLHATTTFYLPDVEVNAHGFELEFRSMGSSVRHFSVAITSDVQCVSDYLQYERGTEEPISISNLIRGKIAMPFRLALEKNRARKALGLDPIRNLVIGDMNIPFRERGINQLFSNHVRDVLREFQGCFDSVTICGSLPTIMHLTTYEVSQRQVPHEVSQRPLQYGRLA